MKKLWNQNSEARALIVATLLTILGGCGTTFLFWFHRYDIPLGVMLGGIIVALSWLALYLIKRSDKPHIKLDITFIYIRLTLIVALAVLFGVLSYHFKVVIVSPIYLIISYLVISLLTMVIYIKKGAWNVW